MIRLEFNMAKLGVSPEETLSFNFPDILIVQLKFQNQKYFQIQGAPPEVIVGKPAVFCSKKAGFEKAMLDPCGLSSTIAIRLRTQLAVWWSTHETVNEKNVLTVFAPSHPTIRYDDVLEAMIRSLKPYCRSKKALLKNLSNKRLAIKELQECKDIMNDVSNQKSTSFCKKYGIFKDLIDQDMLFDFVNSGNGLAQIAVIVFKELMSMTAGCIICGEKISTKGLITCASKLQKSEVLRLDNVVRDRGDELMMMLSLLEMACEFPKRLELCIPGLLGLLSSEGNGPKESPMKSAHSFAEHVKRPMADEHVQKIRLIIESCPELQELRQLSLNGIEEMKLKLNQLHPLLESLLTWVVHTNRAHIRKLDSSQVKSKSLHLLGENVSVFELCNAPIEKERKFQEMKKNFGSSFGFHGSAMVNWFSIMRNGLKNCSEGEYKFLKCNGAANGPGIYLTDISSLAMLYSKSFPKPHKSSTLLGIPDENTNKILAICEYIEGSDRILHKTKYTTRDGIHVFPNEETVRIRYLVMCKGHLRYLKISKILGSLKGVGKESYMQSKDVLKATGVLSENTNRSVSFYKKVSKLLVSLENGTEITSSRKDGKVCALVGEPKYESSDNDLIFLREAVQHCYENLLPKKLGGDLEELWLLEDCQMCWEAKSVKIHCGCEMSYCKPCLSSWIKSKVKTKEVYPWILCPSQKCMEPLQPRLLLSLMDVCLLANFVKEYLKISLIRSRNWATCANSNCSYWATCANSNRSFGFINLPKVSMKTQTKCHYCGSKWLT